jgi:hypothetical protein
MLGQNEIAWRKLEILRAHRMREGCGMDRDVRETGAALDAGEEGGDEDCVEGEVG